MALDAHWRNEIDFLVVRALEVHSETDVSPLGKELPPVGQNINELFLIG